MAAVRTSVTVGPMKSDNGVAYDCTVVCSNARDEAVAAAVVVRFRRLIFAVGMVERCGVPSVEVLYPD